MKETKILYDTQIFQGTEGDQEWVSVKGSCEDLRKTCDLFDDMRQNHPHEKFRVIELEVVSTMKRVLLESFDRNNCP